MKSPIYRLTRRAQNLPECGRTILSAVRTPYLYLGRISAVRTKVSAVAKFVRTAQFCVRPQIVKEI